jgi:hypothetical protein
MDHERVGFTFVPRFRTAPQFPHLHSTVGLSASSTGGALGTPNDKRRRNDLEGLL